ncbi:MAG: glycosyltransferase [Gammaproteobacteria bacterium]|nr:glycosyltransferase [Gammaproteobacteria bacterium]
MLKIDTLPPDPAFAAPRPERPAAPGPFPLISFIIPAHDEAATIGRAIGAVQDAAVEAGAPYEIIVVDDASGDGTAALAGAAGARVVGIDRRQIAAARNAGAGAARGDTFVFVDADTLIDAAVVRGVMDAIRGGAIGGGAEVRFDEPTPRYVRIVLPVALWCNRWMRIAFGCFLFCTRRAFQSAGGFDEKRFAGEELAMSLALRKQGRFVMLRRSVVSSGRKLRTHSAAEVAGALFRAALGGRRGVRDRSRLPFWYGPRRKDPSQGEA